VEIRQFHSSYQNPTKTVQVAKYCKHNSVLYSLVWSWYQQVLGDHQLCYSALNQESSLSTWPLPKQHLPRLHASQQRYFCPWTNAFRHGSHSEQQSDIWCLLCPIIRTLLSHCSCNLHHYCIRSFGTYSCGSFRNRQSYCTLNDIAASNHLLFADLHWLYESSF